METMLPWKLCCHGNKVAGGKRVSDHGHTLNNVFMGAFTYDVSSRGGGGFKMLTVADKGGRGSKPC